MGTHTKGSRQRPRVFVGCLCPLRFLAEEPRRFEPVVPALFGEQAAGAAAAGWSPEGATPFTHVATTAFRRDPPKIFKHASIVSGGPAERLRWKAGQEAREAFLLMVLRGLRELLATQAAGAEWAHGEDSILTLGRAVPSIAPTYPYRTRSGRTDGSG